MQIALGLFVRSNHHFQPAAAEKIEAFPLFVDSNWKIACKEARLVAEKILEKIP
jgi:hypothetical protein